MKPFGADCSAPYSVKPCRSDGSTPSMKPFSAPNRPFCVKPFAPLMHQPRSVIDAGLVYWGSHESEPQKTQQLGCVSCLRVGIVEVGLLSFGHSSITVTNARRSFEDEVDDTYYTHTYRQTNKQTRTSRQTHRQTHSERQTDRQTHIQKGRRATTHINKRTNTQVI